MSKTVPPPFSNLRIKSLPLELSVLKWIPSNSTVTSKLYFTFFILFDAFCIFLVISKFSQHLIFKI